MIRKEEIRRLLILLACAGLAFSLLGTSVAEEKSQTGGYYDVSISIPGRPSDTHILEDRRMLQGLNGSSPIRMVIKLLDRLTDSRDTRRAGEFLAAELHLKSSLYRGRDKFETERLRGYVFACLSRTYVPDSALPYLVEALTNSQDPFTRAAACRAAAELQERGRPLVPLLVVIARGGHMEVPVALEQYSQFTAPENLWTTNRIEAVRALRMIGANSRFVTDTLQAILKYERQSDTLLARQLTVETRNTVSHFATIPKMKNLEMGKYLESFKYAQPEHGTKIFQDTMSFLDQNGMNISAADLRGASTVIAFFYTRCSNPDKCQRVVDQLRSLRQTLRKSELADAVNIVLVTFEPHIDDSKTLNLYGKKNRFGSDERMKLLRPSPNTLKLLVHILNLPVSMCCDKVTAHDLSIYRLDQEGRFAGSYFVASNFEVTNRLLINDLNADLKNQ